MDTGAQIGETSAVSGSFALAKGGAGPHTRATPVLTNRGAVEEADVWDTIDALAGQERWAAVLELIEQHEFDLDPWRMAPLRVRGLIKLGWRRRALEQLAKAYEDGYVRGREAVALMVGDDALAVAARFIDSHMSEDVWQDYARTSVLAGASAVCAAASLQDAPLQFADAIQAQDILLPGREETQSAIALTLQVLTTKAGELLATDDPASATVFLCAAARLAPGDRTVLESLAEAALRADLIERRLDTLLRIWTTHRDTSALLAAARGVLATSSWTTISEVMTIASAEASALGSAMDDIAEQYRELACRRLDDYILAGDIASGLELVVAVSRQCFVVQWPDALLSRLLQAAKRRLRNQAGGEALIAAWGPLYLELSPLDADVCRRMARVRMQQRRLGEARELLDRVVSISPHVAGDWIALAMVQADMGDVLGRDLSVARAILISPDVHLPPQLAPVRERLGLS